MAKEADMRVFPEAASEHRHKLPPLSMMSESAGPEDPRIQVDDSAISSEIRYTATFKKTENETTGVRHGGKGNGFDAKAIRNSITPQLHELDTAFLCTIPGLLKLAEIVLSFVVYVCALAARSYRLPSGGDAAWVEALALASAILGFLALLARLAFPHALADARNHRGAAFMELATSVFAALWWLVGGCTAAATAARLSYTVDVRLTPAAAIASLLCFLLFVMYALSALLAGLDWSGKGDKIPQLPKRANKTMDASPANIQNPVAETVLKHETV